VRDARALISSAPGSLREVVLLSTLA